MTSQRSRSNPCMHRSARTARARVSPGSLVFNPSTSRAEADLVESVVRGRCMVSAGKGASVGSRSGPPVQRGVG